MKNSRIPVVKNLVLIGGGHAHVHTIKSFAMQPLDGVHITVVSRDVDTPYSGMLPGYIAGHYGKDECYIDLLVLSQFTNARFIKGEVVAIDTVNRTIKTADKRPPIPYDVLSIDIGSTPIPPTVLDANASSLITAVKPIGSLNDKVAYMLKRLQLEEGNNQIELCIVGGGVAGVEVLLALQHRLKKMFGSLKSFNIKFSLLTSGKGILKGHNKRVQAIFYKILEERGVTIHHDCDITTAQAATEGKGVKLTTSKGQSFTFDECIWCTNAGAQNWLKDTNLKLSEDSFIEVSQTLESVNTPDVFAAGDICSVVGHPRPKAGVFAVRAGPYLTKNIRSRLSGKPLVKWVPQSVYLSLISTGDKYAVASYGSICLKGAHLWKWKDSIDKAFMKKYKDLPQMQKAASYAQELYITQFPQVGDSTSPNLMWSDRSIPSDPNMRCGGCGCKVGANVLTNTLPRLTIADREEVVKGLDTPDDAAIFKATPSSSDLMIQTMDYFKQFMDDPFIVGRVAAIHALSDCYAMGAEPLAAVALAVLPFDSQKQISSNFLQLMTGCCEELQKEGCALVGGHTSEGHEVAMGLTITGRLREVEKPLKKTETEGAKDQKSYSKGKALATIENCYYFPKGSSAVGEGCDIIITKALGTGVIFAAYMRRKAKGRWIYSAVSSMTQSNATAGSCLKDFDVRACTDITGFGLLGHLAEVLDASVAAKKLVVERRKDKGSADDTTKDELISDSRETSVNGSRDKVGGTEKGATEMHRLSATIDMKDIPILDGAVECIKTGITSSLHSSNEEYRKHITNDESARKHFVYPLLFDPQTSGGLMIIINSEDTESCIAALQNKGYVATRIGSIHSHALQEEEADEMEREYSITVNA